MTQGNPQEPQAPSAEAIMKDILERAGLEDINDVPLGAVYFLGAKSGTFWRAEQPVPIAGYDFLRIYALFQNAHEVRVYAVPVAKPGEGFEAFPHRFTLSKSSTPYFVEIIRNVEVFKDEIAAELARLMNATMEALYPEGIPDEDEDDEGEDDDDEEPAPPPARS